MNRNAPTTVELFTANDVAGFCQVDLKTIHNWADKGTIRHFRTPGRERCQHSRGRGWRRGCR